MREVANWQKSPLVLVVGDKESAWQLMRYALESIGYAVEEAAGGVRALSAYERWQLRTILLDVLMARMDGSQRGDKWKTH